jgi:DNA-binding LacI/PurR family transcriptional regulator
MTLSDLATASRVSVKTASRVMNDHPRVRPYIRERVLSAAARMNYRPNLLAQSLRNKASSFVPVMVKNIHNPFHGRLVEELCRRLTAQELTPLLVDSPENIGALCGTLHPRGAIGLLLHDPALLAGLPADLRLVTLLGATYLSEDIPNVAIGYDRAYRAILRRLHAEGRRRPLFLVDSDDVEAPEKNSKYLCLRDLLASSRTEIPWCKEDQALSRSGLSRLRRTCDTIFCNNDTLALRVTVGLLQAGIRIPADIRIIGSDRIFPLPPCLWSLAIDVAKLAEATVALLGSSTDAPRRTVIPAQACCPGD